MVLVLEFPLQGPCHCQVCQDEAGRSKVQLADACGYPLEQALELAVEVAAIVVQTETLQAAAPQPNKVPAL
eukprot:3069530-Amphidinium_carterae.1